MKKSVLVILVVVSGLLVLLGLVQTGLVVIKLPDKKANVTSSSAGEITQTPTPSDSITADANNEYKVAQIVVEDALTLTLASNLTEKLNSSEYKEKNNCKALTNGGFFTEDNKHIGLFVTNGNKISDAIKNSLFNGYFYVDGVRGIISYSTPSEKVKLAIQSGPVVIFNSKKEDLKLTKDENARRTILATTQDSKIIFIAFYSANNLFTGPKLSELAELINKYAKENGFSIKSAINLDGGFHSAFISDDIELKEIPIPGSYFCIKTL